MPVTSSESSNMESVRTGYTEDKVGFLGFSPAVISGFFSPRDKSMQGISFRK